VRSGDGLDRKVHERVAPEVLCRRSTSRVRDVQPQRKALALAAAPEARADLEALARQLEGVQGAEGARRMALLLGRNE